VDNLLSRELLLRCNVPSHACAAGSMSVQRRVDGAAESSTAAYLQPSSACRPRWKAVRS